MKRCFEFYLLSFLLASSTLSAQSSYWQQNVEYKMVIDFDDKTHRYSGQQILIYTNNSPDTLNEVYYHLYLNAFQPGSMMDVRSRNLPDPDMRINDRILNLKEDEIGFEKVESMEQDGLMLTYEITGTILRVKLAKSILPGEKTELKMRFNAQVPVQIRRTGRNNIEGIDYSMAQWYPKISEYDDEGWHANSYIAREFYGVWGNYDVEIRMDSSYTIAATGILQNAEEIGKGYTVKKTKITGEKLNWHFKAENVHDFVWAADRNYIHDKVSMKDGTELHFFYQNDTAIIQNWKVLPTYTEQCFELMNKMVGKYPYSSYSVIQGGDGGMEYPMATLILGNGKQHGLISVMVHEVVHSWFQGVLGNDEGTYPWMDEGFNTYFNHLVMDSLFHHKKEFAHAGSYSSYFKLLQNGEYEVLSTHSDHYKTNRAYGVAAYSMGCIFLNQLEYIIGSEAFKMVIHRYYNTWKFKHPTPTDLKRIAEKVSKMELDWYFNYFIYTDRRIDYAIVDLKKDGKSSVVELERIGSFPMPVDLRITLKDGQNVYYTIPLRMMLNNKKTDLGYEWHPGQEWPWTNDKYTVVIPYQKKDIEKIEIDPSRRMADVDRTNNVFPLPKTK